MNRPTVHLKNLNLDLRGLPRATAEAVPSHLAGCLEEALAKSPPAETGIAADPASLHLNLDSGASPREIAGAIATALARGLRAPENSRAKSR